MKMRQLKVKVRIVVEKDEDSFHAFCPDLAGVHADGATESEALINARDAVGYYLVSLVKHDDPIPLGMLTVSDSTISIWSVIGRALKEKFTSHARSFVESINVPATA